MTIHDSIPFPSSTEKVYAVVEAIGARLSISDQRMTVSLPELGKVLMDMPLEDLRRVQFDIERDRPATMVIVPHQGDHQLQVLAIPRDEIETAAVGLGMVGLYLADASEEAAS
jgi:hypothetical protein